MPQSVIIHAGTHKTGTTALQQVFCDQEARLAESGILYPRAGRMIGHHGLINAIMQKDRSVPRAFWDETRDAERVLLSSELTGCLSLPELDELRRLFPGASFEVVVVLRRLPSLWPSHWRELVKHGMATPFGGYLSEVRSLLPPSLSAPVRPAQMLQDCAATFGRESLKILVFDSREHGAPYGVGFARDVLRLNDAGDYSTRSLNWMPAPWKVELGRIFHSFGMGWINHVGRKAIFNGLIGKLDLTVPAWVEDFRALLDAAEPIVLTERTPLVAEQYARLLDLFSDCFLDPPEALTAPLRTEVRCLPTASLPEPLETEMRKEFRAFRERFTNT